VISVFPAVVVGVVGVSHPVVFDAVADFHAVFLKVFESSGHVEVDHGFLKGIGDGDEHGGVFAGGITGFVVLGADIATFGVEFEKGLFPSFGDSVGLDGEYWDTGHVISPVMGFGWIVTFLVV
jgi:hypothetical protein